MILAPQGLPFVHWAELSNPLSEAAKDAAKDGGEGLDVVLNDVEGFVVVTQTCDLARDPTKRPFVELAPLVKADEGQYKQIAKLAQPRYAVLPAVSDKGLVADLDRIMTVEKSVLAKYARVRGLVSDDEQRSFARALARKRSRPALPNDFIDCFRALGDHLKGAFKKDDAEARHLRALAEFRAKPDPSWNAGTVSVTLYVFKAQEDKDFKYDWATLAEQWRLKFKPNTQFVELHIQVLRYDQLDALTYITSDELDLDNISPPT